MSNKSFYSYQEPIEKFEKISGKVIMKFDLEVIGLYCKMVMLSRGKILSMDFLSKRINVSVKKLRRIIVFLESEGYITRNAMKDANGKFAGWHYRLWAEPVSDKKKTHAGKADLISNGLDQKRTSPQADKSVNGKENIISTDNSIYNETDNNCTIINSPVNKEETDICSGESTHALTDEERFFIEKMKERYPRVMKMQEPLTLEQAKKAKGKYDELVYTILDEMENWAKLYSKVSAYKTLLNWCKKETERL